MKGILFLFFVRLFLAKEITYFLDNCPVVELFNK